MTQQSEAANHPVPPDTPVWFGAWHGCSGTYLGESYIEVPKRCLTHGGPLMAEPDYVRGVAYGVTYGTVHLDYAVEDDD